MSNVVDCFPALDGARSLQPMESKCNRMSELFESRVRNHNSYSFFRFKSGHKNSDVFSVENRPYRDGYGEATLKRARQKKNIRVIFCTLNTGGVLPLLSTKENKGLARSAEMQDV